MEACDMDTSHEITCSSCNTPMMPSANFCSNCGKALRIRPPSTTVTKQIIVYLISFFLAPFGLYYAWKYLRQGDRTSKIIGIVAVSLTIVAVGLALWTTAELFNLVYQYWDSLRKLGL